jgi:hypothetical protein
MAGSSQIGIGLGGVEENVLFMIVCFNDEIPAIGKECMKLTMTCYVIIFLELLKAQKHLEGGDQDCPHVINP